MKFVQKSPIFSKSKLYASLSIAALILIMSSCIPQKNIVMLHSESDTQTYPALTSITDKYVLQPNDYLFINVSSPDPRLSQFFNPMTSGGSSSSTTQFDKFTYMINDSSQIDFPIIGKIDLKGCNIDAAKQRISEQIANYLTDFTLTVRLHSNTFAVLGEVNHQGQLTMSRDQITIFDAIAQAGGFTSYAKRKEVKIVRKLPNGEAQMHVVDLTKDDVINSEFYYIYPNDIIYVRPMRVKMIGFGETFSLGLVTSLVTLYLLIISL